MTEKEKFRFDLDGFTLLIVMGENGFYLDFKILQHNGYDEYTNRPCFDDDDGNHTEKVEDAEIFSSGFVKSDGCCNFTVGSDDLAAHVCGGLDGFNKFSKTMQKVYEVAKEKLKSMED